MTLHDRVVRALEEMESRSHAKALDLMARAAIARQQGWVDGRNTNWYDTMAWYRAGKKWVSTCGNWQIHPYKGEYRLIGYGGRWTRKTDLMCKKLAEEKNGQRTT